MSENLISKLYWNNVLKLDLIGILELLMALTGNEIESKEIAPSSGSKVALQSSIKNATKCFGSLNTTWCKIIRELITFSHISTLKMFT